MIDIDIDFIVGMSRTGITWLTRALNLHPQLTTFGQSRFWGKHYRAPAHPAGYGEAELARMHRRLRGFMWDGTVGQGPGCLTQDLERVRGLIDEVWAELRPPVSPARAFTAVAAAFARAGGSTHVLEKTPHHVLHVERIRAHLPRARFVIIETGARDYAAIQRAQVDLPHHPIAVALLFRRYAAACERAARTLGPDAVRVQLQSLIDDPDRALEPVFRLLGVKPISVVAGMAGSNVLGPTADLVVDPPDLDRFWLAMLAGAPLGVRPPPRELVRSLCSLPPWALANLRANVEDVEGSLLRYYAGWLGLGRERVEVRR